MSEALATALEVVKQLTPAEREALCDALEGEGPASFAEFFADPELAVAWSAELERRDEKLKAGGGKLRTWEEAKANARQGPEL